MPGRCAAPPAPAMMTLKPSRLRALGEGDEPVGGAMGGDDPRVIADAERFERLGGAAHDRPVRLAAHDDRDGLSRRSTGPADARFVEIHEDLRLEEGRGARKRRLPALGAPAALAWVWRSFRTAPTISESGSAVNGHATF